MYTEITFPQNNVRFIAVNNGVDSANQGDNEFAPLPVSDSCPKASSQKWSITQQKEEQRDFTSRCSN